VQLKPKWVWEETDPRRSGSSGDVAKLFKNEGVKQPGPFIKDAPQPAATLLAREVVQNSRDAARELRQELGDAAPDFEIHFEFRDRAGEEKRALVEALDLTGLASQLTRVSAESPDLRTKIGLGPFNALDQLADPAPLRTLVIEESGTTGMYGPFVQARSKLFLALISIGYTMKAEGSGGSYGYGKAGLIAGSATRTVVAYTCFRDRPDDPGVTRRLLGMTYWGQHVLGEQSFTGFARLGREVGGWVEPFENEEADVVATSLGLKVRSGDDLDDLGTTFLVLDAEVEPRDLEVAIARNWWPAIVEREFIPVIRAVAADGATERFDVRPKKDPLLQSFVRAWELATTPQDNNVLTELRKDLGKGPVSAGSLPLGQLGAHADLGGWSYAQLPEAVDDDDEELPMANMSLVALVRGPRMVVEYLPVRVGRQPYVRGVFVADHAVDDLLRQTEPKAHDAWQKRVAEEGVDPRAPKVADAILRGVTKAISDFQGRLKPPPPDPGDVRLPIFQDLFRNLIKGKGPGPTPPPPVSPRDVSINLQQRLAVTEDGDRVFLKGHADLALTDHVSDTVANVIARFGYRFLEDGTSGEHCPLAVTPPDGFVSCADGSFRGQLGHTAVRFLFQSDSYSSDWSARLVVSCEAEKGGEAAGQETGSRVNPTDGEGSDVNGVGR
jgi:hypothetical protein